MRTKEDVLDDVAKAEGYKDAVDMICVNGSIDPIYLAMDQHAWEYAKGIVQEILQLSLPLIPENEWVAQYAEYFKIDRSPIERFLNPNPPTNNKE